MDALMDDKNIVIIASLKNVYQIPVLYNRLSIKIILRIKYNLNKTVGLF